MEKDHSDWLPPLFTRKARRTIKKTGQNNNFLCLRENLGETSDEDASKVFNIVKESEYYKAVPINRPPKELNRRILPVTRSRSNDDHPGEKRDFPGRLKIVLPPKLSDKYSSTEMVEDPMVGAKNSHVGLSVNYQEDSGSLENKSELEKSGESLDDASDYVDEDTSDMLELSNTDDSRDESEGESEENVNLKDLLLSEQPEVLMVLPWAKRLSRPRRQATGQEKIDEHERVEKVQPLELQQLEELSSPRVPIYNDVDDVERSMAQKRPLEKYTRKENLVANYIKERKNLEKSSNDRGLPSFIEGNIPKLENVVVDGMEKVQNLTGSVEQLVEDLNEEFDETSNNDEQPDYTNAASTGIAQHAFQHAIMGVQKIFALLSGITRILRG